MTEPGHRVYAVGDVHGRHDLLRRLMKQIVSHFETSEKKPKQVHLIFLGDIIDRGPDSASCLRLVHDLVQRANARLLRGNHEDLLLHSIDGDPVAQRIWLDNGGLALLHSFGVEEPSPSEDAIDFGDRVRAAIPEPFLETLRAAPLTFENGDYLFVHAGVRPGVRLSRQDEQDLLFIREDFTSSDAWHGAVVVHGHSIVGDVEILKNRIAVDTGAYRTDKLSCVVLDGRRRSIIST